MTREEAEAIFGEMLEMDCWGEVQLLAREGRWHVRGLVTDCVNTEDCGQDCGACEAVQQDAALAFAKKYGTSFNVRGFDLCVTVWDLPES